VVNGDSENVESERRLRGTDESGQGRLPVISGKVNLMSLERVRFFLHI
jgi:hypothetical protein